MLLIDYPNLFQFPLNIMVVDDDEDYLHVIKKFMTQNSVTTFTKPQQVIDNLKPFNVITKALTSEYVTNEFSLNYKNIANLVNNYRKSNEIGILITDYEMPEINGIELCNKLTYNNLIKILLTGKYEMRDGLNALNNKQIDYYLPKAQASEILNVIEKTQRKFFANLSNHAMEMIGHEEFNFMNDIHYSNLFNQIIDENKITTYFVLNNSGCYHLSNETHHYVLSVYTTQSLNEIITDYDIPTTQIKNEQLIPSYNAILMNKMKMLPYTQSGNYYYALEKID